MATWDVLNTTRYIVERVNHIEDLKIEQICMNKIDKLEEQKHHIPLMHQANRLSVEIQVVCRWYWQGFVEYLRWTGCQFHWHHSYSLDCGILRSMNTSIEVSDRHIPNPKISFFFKYLCPLFIWIISSTYHIINVITTVMKVYEITFGQIRLAIFWWSRYFRWYNTQ